jgi:hypothetical protein
MTSKVHGGQANVLKQLSKTSFTTQLTYGNGSEKPAAAAVGFVTTK